MDLLGPPGGHVCGAWGVNEHGVILLDQHGRRHALPSYIPNAWADRIKVFVDEKGVHYLWTGWSNGKDHGHGKVKEAGKTVYCYRRIWEWVKGVKLGRFNWVDHKCGHKPCLNVKHLEAVTPGENTYRGPGRWAQYKRPESYSAQDFQRDHVQTYEDPLDALDR